MECFLFQAVDLDTGPWGAVTYSIYGPGADLYVDPTSGKALGRAWGAEGRQVCATVRSEWGRTRPGFGGEHTARCGGKRDLRQGVGLKRVGALMARS